MAKKDEEIKYEIQEHIVDLTEPNEKGWKKECNLISWNGGESKYDIRSWNEDHTKMGKGIALSYEEFAILCQEAYDRGIV